MADLSTPKSTGNTNPRADKPTRKPPAWVPPLDAARHTAREMLETYRHPDGNSAWYAEAYGALKVSLELVLNALDAETPPAEELISGAQPCGHDDYHDPHEWAEQPHLWCPGIGYNEATCAPFLDAERGEGQ